MASRTAHPRTFPRRHRGTTTLTLMTAEPEARNVARELAAAMGWPEPPTLTEAQEQEFRRRNERAQHDAEEFYARRAA